MRSAWILIRQRPPHMCHPWSPSYKMPLADCCVCCAARCFIAEGPLPIVPQMERNFLTDRVLVAKTRHEKIICSANMFNPCCSIVSPVRQLMRLLMFAQGYVGVASSGGAGLRSLCSITAFPGGSSHSGRAQD